MMIKSYCPRLVLEDTLYRTEGKQKIRQNLNSLDLMFGYLCFLEFGSFSFCETAEIKVMDDKIYVFVNNEWKIINGDYEKSKILKVTILKFLGKDVWDPNFFLMLMVEGQGICEVVDIKEGNDEFINKLMIKSILEKCRKTKEEYNFQSAVFDDEYEFRKYDSIIDILKPKKKEKEKKHVKIVSPEKQIPEKQVITKEITVFTFLKGVKDIKLETIPPLKYRRLS
jgi:hypothetical protein